MDKPHYRAYICCGPNCGPKGSGELLDYLATEIERLDLTEQVRVAATGCQAHCESGPTMVVYPGPIFYQEVTRDRLARIVLDHFMGGVPVQDFFWRGLRPKRIVPTAPSRQGSWDARFPAKAEPGDRSQGSTHQRSPKRPAQDVDDFKW